MNIELKLVADILLVLALVVWVGYRQTTWTAVDPTKMWKMPLILAGVGVLTLAQAGDQGILHVSGLDASLLVVELIVSVGIGALMGLLSDFRPMPEANRKKREQRASGKGRTAVGSIRLETRTGWVGILLWVALIAVRVGLGVVAARSGAELTSSAGVIMLVIAANRAARIGVILARSGRVETEEPVASLA